MPDPLAIDGGIPAVINAMPGWPIHGDCERELLLEVLESRQWGSLTSPKVDGFAAAFARFQGSGYAVCTSSGTTALEAALEALDVGPVDEVVTSAWAFATTSAILTVGAQPVFVDINPTTNTIDPACIESAITPRTKAIMPVHIGGLPADMDSVMAVAGRAGLPVL